MNFLPAGPFVEFFTNKGRGQDALCAFKEKGFPLFLFMVSDLPRPPEGVSLKKKRGVWKLVGAFF